MAETAIASKADTVSLTNEEEGTSTATAVVIFDRSARRALVESICGCDILLRKTGKLTISIMIVSFLYNRVPVAVTLFSACAASCCLGFLQHHRCFNVSTQY